MEGKVYYIILKNKVLLSKKKYENWRQIQDEYYQSFVACLGPWFLEDALIYFSGDYGDEINWPFSKKAIVNFFNQEQQECIYKITN